MYPLPIFQISKENCMSQKVASDRMQIWLQKVDFYLFVIVAYKEDYEFTTFSFIIYSIISMSNYICVLQDNNQFKVVCL